MADKNVEVSVGGETIVEKWVDQGDQTWARKVATGSGAGSAPASVTLPAYTTLQAAVAATGNGTTLDVSGKNTALFDVAGTFVGTVTFETLQADGTTWVGLNALQIGTGAVGPTATGPGMYRANVAGLDTVRARVTWTSGTSVTVKARALLIADDVKPVTNAGGSLLTEAQARRAPEAAYRAGITANDCILPPGPLTLTAITEAGSTLANVAYHVLVAAGNRWGPTTASADPGAITPTLNQAIRCAFAQVVGADYYDIFLSTAAAPLWVGRITEAQRAAGGFIISAVGVTSAGGGAPAGGVDLGIVGTGLASNVNPFAVNFAFKPTSVPTINGDGFNALSVIVRMTVTDLRALPSVSIIALRQGTLAGDNTDWFALGAATPILPLGGAASIPLEREFALTLNGAGVVALLVTALAGQGTSVDLFVQPF